MTDWHERVSQPRYRMKIEKDVFVTMRDGVRIAVDIYRPDSSEKFPALLGMSPYGKDVQPLPVPDMQTDRDFGNGGIEAGNSEYFASRGYVHVIADVRGCGLSEGGYRIFSAKEQQDGYDLVEWIAQQPWASGKVGMLGSSYFGMIQLLVAAQQPPHLAAICPVDSATDLYRHWAYHGGVMQVSFAGTWWEGCVVNKAEPLEIPKAELDARVRELLKTKEVRSYPRVFKALKYPQVNPHLFDVALHPLDGPYYHERSAHTKFDRIKIPVCLIGRWTSANVHLPGEFQAFSNVKGPKKLFMTIPESGVGFNRPWHENHDLVLRWYDHWLKGNDTGVMEEPPIRLFVQQKREFRDEREWPLARTKWTKLHLAAGGVLREAQAGWNDRPGRFVSAPALPQGAPVPSVKCRTEPLPADLEVTGPVALTLFGSINASDTNWMTDLVDVHPDGKEERVSMGWLKASHREIDEARSKPYQPYHPHTRAVPVEPGRVEKCAIEIRETSWVFKAGHRLQLTVKAQDAPWEGTTYLYKLGYHLPPSEAVQHTVHSTPEYPSHLLLPVIP